MSHTWADLPPIPKETAPVVVEEHDRFLWAGLVPLDAIPEVGGPVAIAVEMGTPGYTQAQTLKVIGIRREGNVRVLNTEPS